MRTAATKGRSWRLIAAGIAALVTASAVEASRFTPSAANDLLEKQGNSSSAAAQHAGDPAPAFASEPASRFPLLAAADRGALTAPLVQQLAGELETALEGIAGEKLASGGLISGLRPNLWRLNELTTISHPSRFGYARNRWYDARNASWLSEDPAQDIDSPNLYAYVGWQPHMATDPMGMQVAVSVDCNEQFHPAKFGPLTQNSGGWGAYPIPEVPAGTVRTCGFAVPADSLHYIGSLNAAGVPPGDTARMSATHDTSARGELSLGLARGTALAAPVVEPLFDVTIFAVSTVGFGTLSPTGGVMTLGGEEGLGVLGSKLFSQRPAQRLAANRTTGLEFQARVGEFRRATQVNVAGEVSIKPNAAEGPVDWWFRIDYLGREEATQSFRLTEAKSSPGAHLTTRQKEGFRLFKDYGGTVIGKKGGTLYPPGTQLPPGEIQIIRPADLPPGY